MNRPVIPLRLLICLALAAITFGLYWPVQTHDYICFDDPQFVTENPIIQSGLNWKSIVWAFTHSVAVNWHPVTTLSHALDCQLFGVNPGAHHLVNAFFHSINGALLFLLLARMTGFTWRSAVVAGVFALHPLRVESVAWLAERKDVLSGFFFMLTLLAYAAYSKSKQSSVISEQSSEKRARHQPSAINYQPFRYYALTLLCFALGLMSKPMLVTLPFVLLLLDFWPLRRIKLLTTDANRVGNQQRSTVGYQLSTINYQLFRRCLAEKLPFFAVSAIGCAVTMHMQGVVAQYNASLPMSERINNAVVSYLRYLGKLFWPTKLTIIYPHPFSSYAHSLRWDAWQIAVAALFLLGITLICLWLSRRKPYLALGWFWFLGTLIPVIGLVQVGEQAMADRYTYIPLIGPVISLVWLICECFASMPRRNHLLAAASVGALATCLVLSHRQIGFWRNNLTLFSHALDVEIPTPTTEFGVAVGLEQAGKPAEAAAHYRAALALNPSDLRSHYNLGQLLRKGGQLEEAADEYSIVLRAEPDNLQAKLNLANVFTQQGADEQAATLFEEVARSDPSSIEALNNLAWLRAASANPKLRDGAAAVTLAKRAVELSGSSQPTIVGTLAAAYAETGRFPEAILTAEAACKLAQKAGKQQVLEKNEELLTLYRQGRPYHEGQK